MFGMTKKQFLKKTKNCMKETGIEILLIRELLAKQMQKKVDDEESLRKLEIIRKNIEELFFEYERLKPPSKCSSLHFKVMNMIIMLQDIVVTNLESLNAAKEGKEDKAREKLLESIDQLEQFKDEFRNLTREVDSYFS